MKEKIISFHPIHTQTSKLEKILPPGKYISSGEPASIGCRERGGEKANNSEATAKEYNVVISIKHKPKKRKNKKKHIIMAKPNALLFIN